MLETLRKLSPDAKRKFALAVAGFITLLIFLGWALQSSAIFTRAYDAARSQGIAIFGFFDQNVQEVYTSFKETVPDLNLDEDVNSAFSTSTNATATDFTSQTNQ